jgi:hypothetical protein
MTQKVVVAGVGMIPFKKPGASETYPVMGAQAVRIALANAGSTSRARRSPPARRTSCSPSASSR